MTPTVLALYERVKAKPPSLKAFSASPLLGDILWMLLALLVLTISANEVSAPTLQQVARLGMVLTVVWMAFRYGWHGTAFGGLLVSGALALTSHGARDPAVIQCQVVLAAVLSMGLLWGKKPRHAEHAAEAT